MEDKFSWKKAFLGSISIHLGVAICLGIFIVNTVSEKPTVYEIDLQTATSAGSGHSGGGNGGGVSFPEPLKAAEVTARREVVSQQQSKSREAVTDDTVSHNVVSQNQDSEGVEGTAATGGGSGIGNGTGTGKGDGSGDGRGYGDGAGDGEGSGYSGAQGRGSSPFDRDGFWSAVNQAKQYPAAAIKRRLTGAVTLVTTIDTDGNCIGVDVISSSGHDMLDKAGMRAVQAACPYPNPTGTTVTVETTIHFDAY